MNEFTEVITKKYAQFSGRARRREYWMYTLINTLILLVLNVLESTLGLSYEQGDVLGGGWVSGLYSLLLIIPSLAVAIRRLHDTGRSGWTILLGFIPLVNFVLIYFLAQDSTKDSNKWGPNPKALTGSATPAQTSVQNW
jgi:uncharacterized membrane protein YhaH (DUF805 family)